METLYRSVFESSPDAMVVVDESETIRLVNPATERLFGYPADQLVGERISILMPHGRTDGGSPHEVIAKRRDGTVLALELFAVEWRDRAGNRFSTCTFRNIADSRAAEAASRPAREEAEAVQTGAITVERGVRAALDALPGGFVLFDHEDRLIAFNNRMTTLYARGADLLVEGVTYEALLRNAVDRGIFDLSAAADREDWIRQRLAYHRDPKGADEIQLVDGRWIRLQEHVTREGGRVGLRIDVTDLKEGEAAFEALFEANPIPMWLVERESFRIVGVNRAALARYGYPREAFMEMHLPDLHDPTDGDGLRAAMAAADVSRPGVGIWRHHRANGSKVVVELLVHKLDFQGKAVVLCAAVDVTEHQRIETALREAKEDAEAASRMKSRFLATMSHELRTPLNAVIGFSQMMQAEMIGPLDPRYREYAVNIRDSGRHLLRIVEDVLDLSRVEAGALELSEGFVDLVDVFRTCEMLVRGRAKEADLDLIFAIPGDLPLVLGDELRVKQIFLNLLSNAVKFTPPGGRVEVEASVLPAASGGGLMVSVSDTGIGMRPEDIDIALEPFRQLDSALGRRYEGCGIGLPLSRTLVELHKGTLTIESDVDEGTTVRIVFPAERIHTTSSDERSLTP